MLDLKNNAYYNGISLKANLIETHISWVLVGEEFVFKIKKPVKLGFLDFSTLPLRKHFCYREYVLNRLYSDIYLGVLPIKKKNGTWHIGRGRGRILDYAVKMKKMDFNTQMDIMLDTNMLKIGHVRSLARVIAKIHDKAERVKSEISILKMNSLFNDLTKIEPLAAKYLGTGAREIVKSSVAWSNDFLSKHAERIHQRSNLGFVRLVHGDLHSGNVFILDPPVLFDCIEFDDSLRTIDVLSEIAFLAMDMEFYKQKGLSASFIYEYNLITGALLNKEDFEILNYYKCYRANIRAKVLFIRASECRNKTEFTNNLLKARCYLNSIANYMQYKPYPYKVEPRALSAALGSSDLADNFQ